MKRKLNNDKFLITMYGIAVFCLLFLFFFRFNPLVVYDTDDWLYVGQFRKPIPIIGGWNPIKVFPETFMPLVSLIGVKCINPFINDYCLSLTIAHSFFGGLILTFYFIEVALLFYKKKLASLIQSILYGLLFFVLHFITNIHTGNNNPFLLWSRDLTCFYNYTLSAIINASLVIHIIAEGGLQLLYKKRNWLNKFILTLWLYFALLSNLFSSVILAAFIGTELLIELILNLKERTFNLKRYIRDNYVNIIVIICWFVTNILETTGGRANDIGTDIISNLSLTIWLYVKSILSINVFISIFVFVVGILWILRKRDSYIKEYKFILYLLLVTSYLLLLSAKTDPTYIVKSDIMIDLLFYVFLSSIYCFNEIFKFDHKKIWLTFILLLTVPLLFKNSGDVFLNYNDSNLPYEKCEAVMNDIINQFKVADVNGYKEIDLKVPVYDELYNWPLADFAGDNIAIALYNHHIIDSKISVKSITPSYDKNEQLVIQDTDVIKDLTKLYF